MSQNSLEEIKYRYKSEWSLNLVNSFYMLSMILINLNVEQLKKDSPINIPFVERSKLGHREIK